MAFYGRCYLSSFVMEAGYIISGETKYDKKTQFIDCCNFIAWYAIGIYLNRKYNVTQ